MQNPDSEGNPFASSSPRAPDSARLRQMIGGLMVLAATASAGYSLYWFYTSLEPRSQARKMHKELEEQQRQRRSASGDERTAMMMFDILVGGGPGSMDVMGTTGVVAAEAAALSAEKSAYQYLCLALALGFPGIWLVWSAPKRPSGPNQSLQPTGPA